MPEQNKTAPPNPDLLKRADQIASENAVQTSNGNRTDLPDSKPGGAQRGGPDLDKAQRRQPPDSDVAADETNR